MDNVITPSRRFGKQTEVFNGFDIGLTGRLPNGAQLSGGVSTGRTVTDTCFANSDPSLLATLPAGAATAPMYPRDAVFCQNTLPFEGQTRSR